VVFDPDCAAARSFARLHAEVAGITAADLHLPNPLLRDDFDALFAPAAPRGDPA
jgi:hypothetical protein